MKIFARKRSAWVAAGLLMLSVPSLYSQQGGLPLGSAVAPVVVNDIDDRPFDFASVLGKKPVLVQFWATWCPICEALLPTMSAAAKKYGDRVEFIGVNVTVNQTPARVKRYIEEHRPPYRTLYDAKGAAVRAFEAPATGFVVIVDAAGKVAYTGAGDKQDLVAALDRIVK